MAVIVDPFTWTEGEIPSAADWTLRFSTWTAEFNGSIDSDNILSASVIDDNFATGIIDDAKMVSAVSMRPTAIWCFKETQYGDSGFTTTVSSGGQVVIGQGNNQRIEMRVVVNLCGFGNVTNGRLNLIHNYTPLVASAFFNVENQSVTETVAANRILTLTGATSSKTGHHHTALFLYSATESRWILLSNNGEA